MIDGIRYTLDDTHMHLALTEARRAWGDTHPNPMVGAVIARGAEVLASGYHARAGEAHAEAKAIRAFEAAGHNVEGCTLYITLEPCSTHGRTPPCTEAILRSGIRRVVVGATDPNPAHAGHGFTILREHGIEVLTGILREKCEDLNLIFNHWIASGTPLFAGKIATTLDGKIATSTGVSQWITGPNARSNLMLWRRYFPAIAVGANTVIKDNPRLTARLANTPEWCPIRFVFDRTLRTLQEDTLPLLYSDNHVSRTVVVHHSHAPTHLIASLCNTGASSWVIDGHGTDFWQAFRKRCAESGITGILFEGGSQILSHLLHTRQLDYLFHYQAPLILGDSDSLPAFDLGPAPTLEHAISLTHTHLTTYHPDHLLRGKINYTNTRLT